MVERKLIIVSNRLPVSVSKIDGTLHYSPSSGGLATAMASLDKGAGSQLWIGWPGISSDELTPAEKAAITRKLGEYNCRPVFLSQDQIDNFYGGYSNATLWPLFHYFTSHAQYRSHYWKAYQEVNKRFAAAVKRYAPADATIWVHDYQLMLLPQLVRTDLPKSSIGFFLHIPFPSFEIFRLLPERKEILLGLLGADLIGFHIYDYVRHFSSSVLRTLGYDNKHGSVVLHDRTVRIDSFPIGIDYQKFTAALQSPEVAQEQQVLTDHYGRQKLILSVDRLDYSKGIEKRLEAFEQFLQQYPQYNKKVTLVVVAVPSRTDVGTYKDLRDHIEQTVSRINGTYASVDWTPISYQFQNLPFEQIVALFARADIALITPLRDGMNLVAKEFVASKQHAPGVLILSEMAGAVDELQEALHINPTNSASIVRALKQALGMPKAEQRQRLQSMQKRLKQYTVQRWAGDFIEQLGYSRRSQLRRNDRLLSGTTKQTIAQAFQHAKRRALFLDYDGTLVDFVSSPAPQAAAPGKALLRILEQLARVPKTDVCIISGRPRDALEDWFGHLPLTLVAEHGFWIKQHDVWAQEDVAFQDCKKIIMPVLQRFAERTPGARVEEKNFALVWHYRNVPPELAYARTAELRHELHNLLAETDIGIYNGHKIIEIKPRGVHKGTVVNEMLVSHPADFVLCMGDDYTDEDMFQVLDEEDMFSVKVGLGETQARFQTPSVRDVLTLLKALPGKP